MGSRIIELPDGQEVCIAEFVELQDDAGAVVWDAALVLAHFLMKQRSNGSCLVQGRTVLELGCGTGAVGMIAAALGAEKVCLTDLPHLVPRVQENIKANALEHVAVSMPLAWGRHHDILAATAWLSPTDSDGRTSTRPDDDASKEVDNAKLACPDVVLASDVVYQEALIQPLVTTMRQLLLMGQHAGCSKAGLEASTVQSGQGSSAMQSQQGDRSQSADITQQSSSFTRPVMLLSSEQRGDIPALLRACMDKHGLALQQVPLQELHEDWACEEIHVYRVTLAAGHES